MRIPNRLHDANAFVLRSPPEGKSGKLLLATLHPFDLDGRGYEARIYCAQPVRAELSTELKGLGCAGWGIDDVECAAPRVLILGRDDVRLKISLDERCIIEWKIKWLSNYVDQPEGMPPQQVLDLLGDGSIPWEIPAL